MRTYGYWFLIAVIASGAYAAQTNAVVIEPLFFRSQAVSAPLPEFATGALRLPWTTVRVVLESHVTAEGAVRSVRVLDEGLKELAAASVLAVQRWRFKRFEEVFQNLKPIERVGRVIFYFTVAERVNVVDAGNARLIAERLKRYPSGVERKTATSSR